MLFRSAIEIPIKYITPIILIGISIALFAVVTNPILGDISKIKTEIASYNQALNNANALENERDQLTQKYNTINPNDLTKLQTLLPDNVDNIRLILEIEKLASPYGMTLEDVKYNSPDTPVSVSPGTAASPVIASPLADQSNKEYGIWDLEFATEGTYSNFVSFVKDLESNLRIVDISSVDFSSDTTSIVSGKSKPSNSYKYDFKIKTYWLKN